MPDAVPPVTPIMKGIFPSAVEVPSVGAASNLVGLTGGVKENLLVGGGVHLPSAINIKQPRKKERRYLKPCTAVYILHAEGVVQYLVHLFG